MAFNSISSSSNSNSYSTDQQQTNSAGTIPGGATATEALRDQMGLQGSVHTKVSTDALTSDVSNTHQKKGKKFTPLENLTYSVIKDKEDSLYGTKKTSYVSANGVPSLDPPASADTTTDTDTYNVAAVDESAEAASANQQWATINSETQANTTLASEEQAQQLQEIQQQLQQIQEQQQAQAQAGKLKSMASVTEGLGITLGAVMIVASIACYVLTPATGGASDVLGAELDADAGIELTATVATDEATNASIDAAADATVDVTEDAAVDETTNTMTASSLRGWLFMGASTMVMSIPQAGMKAINDMALSIEQDSHNKLSHQDALYIAMAISLVSMLVGGGIFSAGSLSGFAAGVAKSGSEVLSGIGTTATNLAKTAYSAYESVTSLTLKDLIALSTTAAAESTDEEESTIAFSKISADSAEEGTTAIEEGADAKITTAADAMNYLFQGAQNVSLAVVKVVFRVITKMAKSLLSVGAKSLKGFGSIGNKLLTPDGALGTLMVLSQAAESSLDLYQNTLNLQLSKTENQFFIDEGNAMMYQADASSTENSITFCEQLIQQQISLATSMLNNVMTTLQSDIQPLQS